ncbi:hypothetical protein OH77DRAFT_371468 [Trametes cingulata]|nr:hypothetical protein OH77DRAFT_371468 [Trametes cingulata]
MSDHSASAPSSPAPPDQAPGETQFTAQPAEAAQPHNNALELASPVSSPLSAPTRTVAIIKHHALNHRFDIELRISDAGFEIVKERQMEFDIETDPDTLYELFGPDYESFAEGPVWVYVLERRRAVEVWHSLMGDPDPEVARRDTPHSLRALYGLSPRQNAVMGSADEQMAEVQIQAIFASSPPFPTTELPDVGGANGEYAHENGNGQSYERGQGGGSLRSTSSSVLSALRNGRAPSSTAGTSTTNPGGGGKPGFKARALPPTHAAPSIVPRMSKAAALRAGIPVETPKRAPPSKERLAQTFANVPGHKRSETITVASVAPPAVAPRMTRAASLRLGIKLEEKPRRPATSGGAGASSGKSAEEPKKDPKQTFEGVPGHKRRETIAVPSTRPPTVAPRLNRSAALRQQKEAAPPSSFQFRQAGPPRSTSRQSFNGTSSARPTISRPPSSASVQNASGGSSRPALSRTTSLSSRPGPRPSTAPSAKTTGTIPKAKSAVQGNGDAEANGGGDGQAKEEPPAKPKPRPSSLQAPALAPRTNKSALLRAAKMAGAALGGATGAGKGKPALAPRAVRA